MQVAPKTMSLRLSPHAYEALRGIADARGVSLNRAVEESIEAMAAAQRKDRLRTAFARLAEAEHGVDFALSAQSEVALAQE